MVCAGSVLFGVFLYGGVCGGGAYVAGSLGRGNRCRMGNLGHIVSFFLYIETYISKLFQIWLIPLLARRDAAGLVSWFMPIGSQVLHRAVENIDNIKKISIMEFYKWIRAGVVCLLGGLVFVSCDDDDSDDGAQRVPDVVRAAFAERYGDVGYVEWDVERGGSYYVAEFYASGREHSAWYTAGGTWAMTEVDYGINLTALPEAVQAGYAATSYGVDGWIVDDIDEIQRPGYDTVYRIEVEKAGQPDCDLYFDLNGTLYDTTSGGGGGIAGGDQPQGSLPQSVDSLLDAKYPGAVVVDFDSEPNGFELDIRHDGKSKEVHFGSDYRWAYTSTDCLADIPAFVRDAVQASAAGAGKRIDDCDYVEMASGEVFYLVDLDNSDRDLMVYPDGTVTEVADR